MVITIDEEMKKLLIGNTILPIKKELCSNNSANEVYLSKLDESKTVWCVDKLKVISIESTLSQRVFLISGVSQLEDCQKIMNIYAEMKLMDRLTREGVTDEIYCVYTKLPESSECFLVDFYTMSDYEEYRCMIPESEVHRSDDLMNEILVFLANLSENYKNNVRLRCGIDLSGIKDGVVSSECDMDDSSEESKIVFHLCRLLYPELIHREIKKNKIQAKNRNLSTERRSIAEIRNQYFPRVPFGLPIKEFGIDEGIRQLDRSIVGLYQEKKRALQYLKAHRRMYWGKSAPQIYKMDNRAAPSVVILVGEEGSGKNLFARELAKVVSHTYSKIDVGSLKDAIELLGSSTVYQNSEKGALAKKLLQIGDNGCLIIDRFGNLDPNIKSSMVSVMTQGVLWDNNLECGIDVSRMVFIMTANSISEVPGELSDNACVIRFSKMREEERIRIGQDHMFPEICEQSFIDQNRICFEGNVFGKLCNSYVSTASLDQIHSNIQEVLQEAANVYKDELEQGETVYLTDEFVKEALFHSSYESYIHDMCRLSEKFRRYRECFSKKEQELIEDLFEEYRLGTDGFEKEKLEERLRFLVNYAPIDKPVEISLDRIVNSLKTEMDAVEFGHDAAKAEVIHAMTESVLSGKGICSLRLFLCGPAGIGKTRLAQIVANVLRIPMIKVSLNGMEDPQVLKGHSRDYLGSHMGCIPAKLSKCGKQGAVVLFDELEKASIAVQNSIFDIVDPSVCGYYDNFASDFVDVSRLVFIITGNSLEGIPHALLDRFTVIHVDAFSEEDRFQITKNYVIPDCLSSLSLQDKVFFKDDAIGYINNYSVTTSVREIERNVKRVVIKEYEARYKNTGIPGKMTINRRIVKKNLGVIPIETGNIPEEYSPGLMNCLAVRGDGSGCVFPVEVVPAPYLEERYITGSCKEMILDSVKIAEVVVSNLLRRKLDNVAITFSELATPKDGPSAGLSIVLAMMSAHLNVGIPKTVGATGEVDLQAGIYPVGGLNSKLDAAKRQGITTIYVPQRNYEYMEESGELDRFTGMRIIPVNNVSQVVNDLFGEALS